ncbi:MAG: signal peptidase I [Succinivibrio sp.]|nr:signal peptidase I [Succinivibrio sp.]
MLFSYILFVLVIVSGIAYVQDHFFAGPKRKKALEARLESNSNITAEEKKKILEKTGIVGELASMFWVLLVVFVFRAFIYEPFRIPSGSMLPTLQPGDFIAVEKWSYGIRNPLTNEVWIDTGRPERGEIAVFLYPEDESTCYIKRIVGLPGDTVIYKDKELFIKEKDSDTVKPVARHVVGKVTAEGIGFVDNYDVYEEKLGEIDHHMMVNQNSVDLTSYYYKQSGGSDGEWVVPEDCYFAMGDNRDNSKDSRFWGFVPNRDLIGRTVGIWLSFDFERSPDDWLPSWIPTAVNFDRIGGVH